MFDQNFVLVDSVWASAQQKAELILTAVWMNQVYYS